MAALSHTLPERLIEQMRGGIKPNSQTRATSDTTAPGASASVDRRDHFNLVNGRSVEGRSSLLPTVWPERPVQEAQWKSRRATYSPPPVPRFPERDQARLAMANGMQSFPAELLADG